MTIYLDDDEDDFIGEAYELDGDDLTDGMDEDEAEAVRDRRTTARRTPGQQALIRRAARQQLASLRRPLPTATVRDQRAASATTAVRRTQDAVRAVDLRQRVQTDEVDARVRAHGRRAEGLERAVAAGIVAAQLQATFGNTGALNNNVARTVLPLSSLLFLRPARVPAWQNPKIVAPALVAAMVLGKDLLGHDSKVASVRVTATNATRTGETVFVKAEALDARGRVIPGVTPQIVPTGATATGRPGFFQLGAAKSIAEFTATEGTASDTLVINVK
ncbi:hypothetical protein [Actinoplanes auranticolor]|uniref:Uncharacterized protein n=1 Tax=Actinoplanes auranticolor TaxID=47988 RepID=A0A919VV59_9ACTN|nr:hypothetical protein [Actinoplanes auranticolor]GIM76375.1 hypothetical protein Aau02nite_70540 [Actinoplanes auranticolor]